MGGEDEAEVFLSLEDDEPVAAPEPPQENPVLAQEVEPETTEVLDPEIVDSHLSLKMPAGLLPSVGRCWAWIALIVPQRPWALGPHETGDEVQCIGDLG